MIPEHDRSAPTAPSGFEPAAGIVLDQAFDRTTLVSLRNAVAAHGSDLGMSREAVEHLVLAAYELASNAVRHGGGEGRLRLSLDGTVLRCVVSDEGPGFPDTEHAGRMRPEPTASGGRGLWLVRCVAAHLDIRSDGVGTTTVAEFPLG
ncbi:MAG TPA: ATP-binding protein [Rugosimonospora sp.]